MQKSVFEFDSYKELILAWLDSQPNHGHGLRSKFAAEISTQTAFITQVLTGAAHFNGDQIYGVSKVMSLTEAEREFFLLLHQFERAGSEDYRRYVLGRIGEKRAASRKLSQRLRGKKFSAEVDQSRYFSSWVYSCVHVMALIPKFSRSRGKMAEALKLPMALINDTVAFLLRTGLLEEEEGVLRAGQTALHLGTDSPFLRQHHLNWNFVALNKIFQSVREDLHYSSVVTVAEDDIERLREIFTKAIDEAKLLIRESESERVCAVTLNFFALD